YTNLRPGRYVFEVLAANNHGVWVPAPAQFAFTVAPAVHQTAWFPALVAALLAGGALGAHRLRVRLVRRRLALENELGLARERERIARDMHDDVGASLTQIALLAERARRPGGAEAGPILGRIAAAARDSARAMDAIVWAVNPRNDRLEPLAAYLCQCAREYLEPAGVRCRLDVPPLLPDRPVPGAVRHHLLLVLKEALGNAVRHAAAAEVTVRLGLEDGERVLAVTENGRGFNPAAAPAGRPGGGNGLANHRRRLESLGGRLVLRSAPGAGTTVEARVGKPGGSSRPQAPSSNEAASARPHGRVRPHD
ncbi:MAG TPA: histidine kinase, partial [Verrucomicrobiota bacterium]|nr:histidine kinase [Verrucomicrobiota bacterium]